MKKEKPTKVTRKTNEPEPPPAFNVRVRPAMAIWLQSKVNRDLRSVPEVIRDILRKQMEKEGG